ncbi:MAG TPA: GNAT family N-acetyltransferase [Rhizomicrobium sp.]|jgi:ribosomal protein S18 acetylase RimI-like enzyme
MQVRAAAGRDVEACVDLVEARRRRYAEFEPRFWKKSASSAALSRKWFAHLITQTDVVAFVAEEDGRVIGFIIGTNFPPPPVIDLQGGKNAVIDDFAVVSDDRWSDVGPMLFDACKDRLKELGYTQIVVIGADKDNAKTAFLKTTQLSLASTWWTAGL